MEWSDEYRERVELREKYRYVFEEEFQELERIKSWYAEVTAANRELRDEVHQLRKAADSAEATLKSERSAWEVKKRRPGKPLNRVIYRVTVSMDSEESASKLGKHLLKTRPKLNDEPERGMKIHTSDATGPDLKLAVDYTVKGGSPPDILRMLQKASKDLGLPGTIQSRDLDCEQQSRVDLPDDYFDSGEGSAETG